MEKTINDDLLMKYKVIEVPRINFGGSPQQIKSRNHVVDMPLTNGEKIEIREEREYDKDDNLINIVKSFYRTNKYGQLISIDKYIGENETHIRCSYCSLNSNSLKEIKEIYNLSEMGEIIAIRIFLDENKNSKAELIFSILKKTKIINWSDEDEKNVYMIGINSNTAIYDERFKERTFDSWR